MCLEEQYGIVIPKGAFYYAEIRHRLEVEISNELRDIVKDCAKQMHAIFQKGNIPAITYGKHCNKCSLNDTCMPKTADCISVSSYLNCHLYEETS